MYIKTIVAGKLQHEKILLIECNKSSLFSIADKILL